MSAAGRKEKIQEFVVRDSGHRQWRMVNAGIGKHLQVKRNYYEAPNQVQKKILYTKRILCSTDESINNETNTQQNETFLPEL